MALLIHGDAAFAGEGIVQETLNLSQLDGYTHGGTLHVVVNNQIGFTTPPERGALDAPTPPTSRKMLQIPIFHVNGEDPEAVAQVVRLAMDFRREFQRDVVIDMYCYRRRGHNEGDEPAFTQPLLYRAIADAQAGARRLPRAPAASWAASRARRPTEIADERREQLEAGAVGGRAATSTCQRRRRPRGVWSGYIGGPETRRPTRSRPACRRERLVELLERRPRVPADFHPHPKIERLLEQRREMARGRAAARLGGGRGAGVRHAWPPRACACA